MSCQPQGTFEWVAVGEACSCSAWLVMWCCPQILFSVLWLVGRMGDVGVEPPSCTILLVSAEPPAPAGPAGRCLVR